MSMLCNQTITAALTGVVCAVGPLQLRDGNPESAIFQGTFTYGSGGTTATAWAQTSVDGGVTWSDVANFSFTTASARFLYNLSALTPVTAERTPTDAGLANNTALDGILGQFWRVKLTTTGVYAGGTILRVDMAPLFGRLASFAA